MLRLRAAPVVSLVAFALAGSLAANAKDGAALAVVPVVLVHGHGSDPGELAPFYERYAVGRGRIPELCAGEADRLKPGDLPRASVVSASYYKETLAEVKFGAQDGSIGACPVPRSDGRASKYKVSWAKRLGRIVDGVLRATGSDRVDLVLHSMGNLVGRSYTRWVSVQGGKSKVRRILSIAGPHRGVNALEATIDALEWRGERGERDFMAMGEISEMCSEYRVYDGKSFTEQLNDGWDAFCSSAQIEYCGITGTGPHGKQVDPTDPSDRNAPRIFGHAITGSLGHILRAGGSVRFENVGEVAPLAAIWLSWDFESLLGPIGYWKPHLVHEFGEATGPGDGVVRFASSRMDEEPFLGAKTWATFEGRHGGSFNVEQSVLNATFATELARQFLFAGRIERGGRLARCELKKVDAPGSASFLVLETTVSGGALVAAQIVEERLDVLGEVDDAVPSVGYGCPLPLGAQRAFIPVAKGGGKRRYRVVAYGPAGPVATKENVVFTLSNGALAAPPTTTLDATPTSVGLVTAVKRVTATAASAETPAADAPRGATVLVMASSNTAPNDPLLRFSFRLDDGAWSPFATSATFDSPVLAPGEHRIEARARHANNAAHLACDDARGAAIGVLVSADGKVTIRR